MSHFSRYRIWLLAAASILATPASAVTLQCADEDELESCTPLTIWTMFQYDYGDDSGEWLDDPSRAEQADLLTQLGSGEAPNAALTQWEGKLPPAALIVWRLLTGKISSVDAVDAARLLESPQERVAVLTTLTQLAPDPAMAAAMNWTLNSAPERAVALRAMLSAGNVDARDWVVNLLLQCSREQRADCAHDLPDGPVLDPAKLPDIWPKLTQEYRVILLARMPLDGLEDFLRRELLVAGRDDMLYALWGRLSASDRAYPNTETILARLMMERLLDPRLAQEPRFQRPLDAPDAAGAAPTFDTLEVRAWRYLVNHSGAGALDLWQSQMRSSNPWVALMGIAGMVANERDVSKELASVLDAQGAPPAELLRLLERVDTETADQLYRQMMAKPPTDIMTACAAITGISDGRAQRLAPELGRWAQAVFSSVPADTLPPPYRIHFGVSPNTYPEPLRSVACTTSAVMRVGTARASAMQPLLAYLATNESLTYQLIGAVLSLEWDDLTPMDRFLDTLSKSTDPALQQFHRRLNNDFANVRRAHTMKAGGAASAKATCEYEMELKGVDVESLVPAEWLVQQPGRQRQRLTLDTATEAGDPLSVICEVESNPRPEVIQLEFPPSTKGGR